jgi:hypothetical protein
MVSTMVSAATPVATVRPDSLCHPSIRDAAEAGINAAARLDRRLEYGGAVFERTPLCFVHSEPVTSLRRNRVEYIIRPAPGLTLVAIFHTHTPGGHDGEFSREDLKEHERLRVPSYLGILGARRENLVIRAMGEAEEAMPASRTVRTLVTGVAQ